MSQSICSRCISRSYLSIESSATSSPSANAIQRAAFSTTPSLAANPPKKKGAVARPTSRQGTTLRLNKNKRDTTGRPPAPGERKALRKKIVLSNTNALEVKGLQELNKENGNAARLAELEGQVLGLTDANVSALRTLEAFKHTQAWNLFRRPATVVRKETVEIAKALEDAEGGEDGKAKKVIKKVLFGEKGSGKTVLQLQAMALALNKGWVVVHLPNGQDLTNGHTSYQPDASGELYAQPHYTANLLDTIVKANEAVLSTMQLSMKHDLPMPVQSNISLARFAELGARDPEISHQIYVALMKELSAPSKPDAGKGMHRVPLFLGFDAIDHAMRLSSYLDAETAPIHSHDLALVNTFARYMTGDNALPNGGMVFAAISESNRAPSATLDYLLDVKHGAATNWTEPRFNPHTGWKAEPMPKWNPYAPFDERVGKCLESAEAMKVEGLNKKEAKGLMEYYAMSGILRNTVTERLVSEKWSLSGGGIIGELERATVRTRI